MAEYLVSRERGYEIISLIISLLKQKGKNER